MHLLFEASPGEIVGANVLAAGSKVWTQKSKILNSPKEQAVVFFGSARVCQVPKLAASSFSVTCLFVCRGEQEFQELPAYWNSMSSRTLQSTARRSFAAPGANTQLSGQTDKSWWLGPLKQRVNSTYRLCLINTYIDAWLICRLKWSKYCWSVEASLCFCHLYQLSLQCR